METKFQKTYTLNMNGKKFHRFQIKQGERTRTYDVCVRPGRGFFEIMTKAQARKRAELLFSMGEELEGITQQLVNRFTQYGETEIKRCYRIAADAGIIERWVKWLVEAKHPLAYQPGTEEWRFTEYIKSELPYWI